MPPRRLLQACATPGYIGMRSSARRGRVLTALTKGALVMKYRILRLILIVDGLLALAVLGLHVADQLSGTPCPPAHAYYGCSAYFKLSVPATIFLLCWGIGTLPVALVILGQWLGATLRRPQRASPDDR